MFCSSSFYTAALGLPFAFSPLGLAVASTIGLGMCVRPVSLSNDVYDVIADSFEALMAKLPIAMGIPLHQAYYASNAFKLGATLYTAFTCSSMSNNFLSCFTSWYVGMPFLFPHAQAGFMVYYGFICFYGFYNDPRFFGKNGSLNDWYHSRRMRELGLDPAKVHAGITMVLTFFLSYKLFSHMRTIESPDSDASDFLPPGNDSPDDSGSDSATRVPEQAAPTRELFPQVLSSQQASGDDSFTFGVPFVDVYA
jgi:hypothetical protein